MSNEQEWITHLQSLYRRWDGPHAWPLHLKGEEGICRYGKLRGFYPCPIAGYGAAIHYQIGDKIHRRLWIIDNDHEHPFDAGPLTAEEIIPLDTNASVLTPMAAPSGVSNESWKIQTKPAERQLIKGLSLLLSVVELEIMKFGTLIDNYSEHRTGERIFNPRPSNELNTHVKEKTLADMSVLKK